MLAANSPYGVYVFANGSRRVSIAEDFHQHSPEVATASLTVERSPGAADYVQVIIHFVIISLGANTGPCIIEKRLQLGL